MRTTFHKLKRLYRWARDTEAPDWVTGPCLLASIGALWMVLDAIEVTMK